MRSNLVEGLFDATVADLDSPSEWKRAQRFFYSTLRAVFERLPAPVQEQLRQRGDEPPSPASLEASRVALWRSIDTDRMGSTPAGAATRAALFAFYPPDKSEGPYDSIGYFCSFFFAAGLPEEALIQAFREQWP